MSDTPTNDPIQVDGPNVALLRGNSTVCQHGSMARKCDICWAEAECNDMRIELAALTAERDSAIQQRDSLLCRIHRDGGHYIQQHGLQKALEDADKIVAGHNVIVDCDLPAAIRRAELLAAECKKARAILDEEGVLRPDTIFEDLRMYQSARAAVNAAGGLEQ